MATAPTYDDFATEFPELAASDDPERGWIERKLAYHAASSWSSSAFCDVPTWQQVVLLETAGDLDVRRRRAKGQLTVGPVVSKSTSRWSKSRSDKSGQEGKRRGLWSSYWVEVDRLVEAAVVVPGIM